MWAAARKTGYVRRELEKGAVHVCLFFSRQINSMNGLRNADWAVEKNTYALDDPEVP
jgi:hypothetical protein